MGTCGRFSEDILSSSGKRIMKFLSECLANYLQEVQQLEQENEKWAGGGGAESQQWSKRQCPDMCSNYCSHFEIIKELQQKVR